MQEQLLAMSLSDNPNHSDNELTLKACESLREAFQKYSKKMKTNIRLVLF